MRWIPAAWTTSTARSVTRGGVMIDTPCKGAAQ
jgi:hypothetical protein